MGKILHSAVVSIDFPTGLQKHRPKTTNKRNYFCTANESQHSERRAFKMKKSICKLYIWSRVNAENTWENTTNTYHHLDRVTCVNEDRTIFFWRVRMVYQTLLSHTFSLCILKTHHCFTVNQNSLIYAS